MSFSVMAGYGLIAVGGGALAAIFWNTRQGSRLVPEEAPASPALPTDALSPHADREKALEVIERRQTVRLLGETAEREVRATISLREMTKTDGRWHETGVQYRALELAGGVWIFKVPRREGGDPIWVLAARVDTPSQLGSFFIGTDDVPGPARLFKLNDQAVPEPFVLPEQFGDAAKYEVTDIGRFKTMVDGTEAIFQTNDMYPFVTAHAADGSRVLLYLDARKDKARGTGGLFTGEVFQPDVDIASLL